MTLPFRGRPALPSTQISSPTAGAGNGPLANATSSAASGSETSQRRYKRIAASGGAAATSSERDEDEADAAAPDGNAAAPDGDAAALVPAGATAAGAIGTEPVPDASRVETGAFEAPTGGVLVHPTPLYATHTTIRRFDSPIASRHRMA
jgi:hypothetical protein